MIPFRKLKRCSLVLLSVMMLLALPACEEGKGESMEKTTTQAPEQNETSTPNGKDSKPQEDDTVELPKVEF